jgi:hypothetical protein
MSQIEKCQPSLAKLALLAIAGTLLSACAPALPVAPYAYGYPSAAVPQLRPGYPVPPPAETTPLPMAIPPVTPAPSAPRPVLPPTPLPAPDHPTPPPDTHAGLPPSPTCGYWRFGCGILWP